MLFAEVVFATGGKNIQEIDFSKRLCYHEYQK